MYSIIEKPRMLIDPFKGGLRMKHLLDEICGYDFLCEKFLPLLATVLTTVGCIFILIVILIVIAQVLV